MQSLIVCIANLLTCSYHLLVEFRDARIFNTKLKIQKMTSRHKKSEDFLENEIKKYLKCKILNLKKIEKAD